MKKLKIGRFILAISLTIILVFSFSSKDASCNSDTKYIKITVYPGDTLWKIAAQNNASKIDIRKLIYEIREINNLESANIFPGQELVVPVKSK